MRVAHFGTFDVENFGDLLFPLLLEWRLAGPGNEFVHVSPAGGPPVWQDCVRTVSTGSVIAQPDELHRGRGRRRQHRPRRAHLARCVRPRWRGAAGGVPGLVARRGVRRGQHARALAGTGPASRNPLLPTGARLARWAAGVTDYLAVRDPSSESWLRDAGVTQPVHIVPDTALELSRLWPRESLAGEFADAFRRRGRDVPERYLCIHLNSRFVDADLDVLAGRIDRICRHANAAAVLLSTGPCHGEAELHRAVEPKLTGRPLVVDRPHGLARGGGAARARRRIPRLLAARDDRRVLVRAAGTDGHAAEESAGRTRTRLRRNVRTVPVAGADLEAAEHAADDYFTAPLSQWEWPLEAGLPLLEEHWSRMRAALTPKREHSPAKRGALARLRELSGAIARAMHSASALLADHAAGAVSTFRANWRREHHSEHGAAQTAIAAEQQRANALSSSTRPPPAPQIAEAPVRDAEERQYLSRVAHDRDAARRVLPDDATVLVVSKGDEQLLRLDGRRCWHFPMDNDGGYAGHYPANDAEAVAQLEGLERGRNTCPTESRRLVAGPLPRRCRVCSPRRPVVHRDDDFVLYFTLASRPGRRARAAGPCLAARSRRGEGIALPGGRRAGAAHRPGDGAGGRHGHRGQQGRRSAVDARRSAGMAFPPPPAAASTPGATRADSADAIAQLEALRPPGGGYLLVPRPASGGSTTTPASRHHLNESHETVWRATNRASCSACAAAGRPRR